MSAICGILGPGVAASELAGMLAALSAHGPNQAGWCGHGAAFACRRHPGHSEAAVVADPDRRFALCANVRLDDRPALCDALGLAPTERADATDAALLLRAWHRWGRDCPAHLSGDWAFVVWDGKRLFCARDHLGVRPLYYASAAGRFAFASSIEAVLAVAGVSAELDEKAVAARLLWIRDPRGYHLFRDVQTLAPGHSMDVEDGSVRIERHWRPEAAPDVRFATPDAYAQALGELLSRAVEDRLPGGPMGVHLSGGLDSSAIAALAARQLRRRGRPPPVAFSQLPARAAELPPEHEAEYMWLNAVAQQEGLRVLHCPPDGEDLVAALRGDGTLPRNNVEFYEMAVQRSAAEQDVRVLLTGYLGDEFVTGSGRNDHELHLLLALRWGELLRRARSLGLGVVSRAVRGLFLVLPRPWWRNRAKRVYRRSAATDFVHGLKLEPPALPNLLRDTGVRGTQLRFLRLHRQALLFETRAAAGVLHGVEYRYPMAARRVIEFALGLPPEIYRRCGQDRWLARTALRHCVPPAVLGANTKTTPAVMAARKAGIEAALPVVLSDLRTCSGPLARARYVSVPRILAALDGVRSAHQLRARVVAGLGLLDFWDPRA